MSDINSGLPFRSQLPGQVNYDDIITKIADGTDSTKLLGVDSAGLIGSKLFDSAGAGLTSQSNGAQQALDVISQASGSVAPGTAAAYAELIAGQYNAALPTLTDGQQAAVQVDSSGRLWVNVQNLPATVDTNFGAVGASTIRTAAQIGNATGAAAFDFGASSAQTLRVAALLGNAAGSADFNYGAIGAQSLRAAAQLGNATGAISYNYGTVDAQTIRVASQIGNATGAANFGNGATGAQTLRVAANLAVGGADVGPSNPVPVVLSADNVGAEIDAYNTASAVAAGATSNHDYTVTALKTLLLSQIEASASGKMKIEIQVETAAASGIFNTKFVQFNSTSNPNMSIKISPVISVVAGAKVRVIRTNKDLLAQDVYSTICGQEIP